jgi:hypothetical protein
MEVWKESEERNDDVCIVAIRVGWLCSQARLTADLTQLMAAADLVAAADPPGTDQIEGEPSRHASASILGRS